MLVGGGNIESKYSGYFEDDQRIRCTGTKTYPVSVAVII